MSNDYILKDFRRLFEQDETRFDTDEFIQYAEDHDYTTDYVSLKTGFIRKKLDDEHFAYQEKMRFEAEERARRAYPFSDEAFEKDWDNHLRAQYAAQQMNTPPANPRDYQYGLPGYTQSLKPIDVSEQPLD